jgi:hypothetical protein
VRPKLLFLFNALLLSGVVFIFRHPVLKGYSSFLRVVIGEVTPSYRFNPDTVRFLYESSMTMLTFVVLMLATPAVPFVRRIVATLAGICLFTAADFFAVRYLVYPQGPNAVSGDTPIYELYLFMKWLMPFIIWILSTYPSLGGLLTLHRSRPSATSQ